MQRCRTFSSSGSSMRIEVNPSQSHWLPEPLTKPSMAFATCSGVLFIGENSLSGVFGDARLKTLGRLSDEFSVSVLRFEANVTDLLVERVGFGPDHIAAQGDLREAAFDRPLLDRLHKTPRHSASAVTLVDDQPNDFAKPADSQNLAFLALDPPDHQAGCDLGDKSGVVRPRQQLF